jgi:TonB family protein
MLRFQPLKAPTVRRPAGGRALVASCGLHLAASALAWWRLRALPPSHVSLREVPTTELTFEAPAQLPPTPLPPALPPSPTRPRSSAAMVRMRTIVDPRGNTTETNHLRRGDGTTDTAHAPGPPRPPEDFDTSASRAPPSLRATELLRAGDGLVPALAAQSYATEQSSESEQTRLRTRAAAPTFDTLAASQHRLPTGTVVHDRAVARWAQESLDPQREVQDLAGMLATAPRMSLGALRHDPPAGATAAGSALDVAHAQSFTSLDIPPGYAPCQTYRALSLLVELTHDATGAVTAARVLRSSGSRRLDEAALETLRSAHDEVHPARGGAAPLTRWLVEVAEDRDAFIPIACGNTGGWTVWAAREGHFGVRVRVRRDRATGR